ncbi:hypothetical protein [Propionivibrio sp.]|uniref:hypothetical protein n=1 Tax=Propionivibrio sp. TaxID=2212460 RepID=UPI0039E6FA30
MSKQTTVPIAVPVVAPVGPRIVKIGTCPSLSGYSELTYHIGCDAKGAIHLRVVGNSGSGKFNPDWVSLSRIESLIAERPDRTTLSAAALRPVFQGKSRNSPSFLFAALLSESIVRGGPDKDSGYLLGEVKAFKQTIAPLIADGTDLSEPSDSADHSDTSVSPPEKARPRKQKES